MIDIERKMRNETKLLEMHPVFRERIEAVIDELETYGYRPRIEVAWRSLEEQQEAFRQGRTRETYDFHNVTSSIGAKEALAADIWDDNNFAHQKTHFMLHLLAAAEANGLTTGLRQDLPEDQVEDINDAIAIKNWDAIIQVGWNPLHVEMTGLTIQEAQAGKRPALPGEQAPVNSRGEEQTMPDFSISFDNEIPPAVENGRYRVENLETGESNEYRVETALKPVILLSTPYISTASDCGAAAAVMLLRAYDPGSTMTPTELRTRFVQPGNGQFLSLQQVRNALTNLRLPTDSRANLTMQDLFAFLAAGKAVLAPTNYKVLSDAGLTEKTWAGPHFAVVVGMDIKNIYVHDPLYSTAETGEAHAYPLDLFWKAWKEAATHPQFPNPERAAIIPTASLGFKLKRKVKVTISVLNIRKGPVVTATQLGTLKKDQIVEISREVNGWGEISGVGWISLAYTTAA